MLAYANVLGYLRMYMLDCVDLETISKKFKKLNLRFAQSPNFVATVGLKIRTHLRTRQG